ncbi:stage V sporulation protein AF [[Clostridium] ultunense Esp]|uniref:spore germination protein n=1 Tax=Thermicanus aegyptius TaxID=94009 RepID=UPI0002B6EED6|nr:spore germination protein [Thermicanus aegyptius]CCQ95602.1 stage V sporulation protein AF [[Clostridium] ultunense Esp]
METRKKNPSSGFPIHKELEENIKILKQRLGFGVSFDFGVREMKLADREMAIFFLNGLTDNRTLVLILQVLSTLNRGDLSPQPFKELFQHYLTHVQVNLVKTIDEAADFILAGLFVLLVDGMDEGFVIDAREYPNRTPDEPDTERVVRGARDGFTESILVNTALTRRRIRDERLRIEMLRVGERSKMDVAILYLQDVADPGLVDLIRKKIRDIEVDGLPMAEKSIQEFVVGRGWNPFPLVRYTERPDVAATHILEGHVLIYVDTSPSVMITPTTFFHHVQHAEEYRQTPVTGAYIRWIRFLGIIASIFLLPLWYLYVKEPHLLPPEFSFIGPKKHGKVSLIVQLFLAEMGVDLMRMAAIHTPTPLATAMGLIAAVLIGDVAIKVGLFSPEVILYLSVAAIGLFSTPSYELSLANRLSRLFLIFMVYLFNAPGFLFGTLFFLLLLVTTRSLNTPYFWPFIPFNLKGIIHILVRMSLPLISTRPSIVHPQNGQKAGKG